QWRAAKAQIWIFDVSLKRLALRIYRPNEPEVIYVIAVGCEHIIGPFTWNDANISITIESAKGNDQTKCRVLDKEAGFELRCSDARVVRGPSTDFEKTFDNFLGDAT